MPPLPSYFGFSIRPMNAGEESKVAQLIFESTNHWYESHGHGRIFQGKPSDCSVFTEVYEDLDPGCCLVAIPDDDPDRIIGSCFYHSRETHISLGIMNADPTSGHKGVAKALLQTIVIIAEKENLPLRLVSSVFNLDSFSLYTRQGFAPYSIFQDMTITVPANGLAVESLPGITVRRATRDDPERIDALERAIWETSRIKDWQYFAENRRGVWSLTVAENVGGELVGALASVNHPGSELLGPGIAVDDKVAKILIQTELNQHRCGSPVFLVPSSQTELVAAMYKLSARNCELHVAQCLGTPPKINGVVMPTFMPETG